MILVIENFGKKNSITAKVDASDYSGTLDSIQRQSQQSLHRRKSLEKAVKSKSSNSINTASAESAVTGSTSSAFNALYRNKPAMAKPPRQKSQSIGRKEIILFEIILFMF